MSYAEATAQALLLYAKTNTAFSSWFVELLLQSPTLQQEQTTIVRKTQRGVLYLRDEYTAVRRAVWLLDALQNKRLPEYEYTIQLLTSWAHEQDRNARQFVVLGLQYGILNYGVIGYPKRRNEPMHVLIRDDVVKQAGLGTIAQACTKLSASIVEQGLIASQGKAHHLEPELADWLFGDKHIVVLTGTIQTLHAVQKTVSQEQIPHTTLTDDKGVTHLATTPALYLPQMPEYQNLTPLDS